VNGYLRWFRWLTWVGVVANLGFILPSIFIPDLLEATLGPGSTAISYVWLALAGVILALATMFYLPAAAHPLRYKLFAWLSVAGRALAAVFWLWQDARWHLPGPIETFYVLDLTFAVIFLVLLWLGFRKGGPPEPAVVDPPAASPLDLQRFQAVLWVSIVFSLVFALWALAVPSSLATFLGASTVVYTYLWLGNAGLLLIQLALFAIPTAREPVRYHVYAWLAVITRGVTCLFWLLASYRWTLDPRPWMIGFVQGLFAVILFVLLQRGLPVAYRLSRPNLARTFRGWGGDIAAAYRSPVLKVVTVILVILLGAVGGVLYTYLLRAEPDEVFKDPKEQFKYGAIGLSMANRVPTYLWEVMPDLCPDLLPGKKNGWASFGLLYEPGHTMPIGFSQRHVGYPSVEPNCALCHTGAVRASETAAPQFVLGGSANELDLESFQWFLYKCSSDPRFTADNVMAQIAKHHQLGWTEAQVYRHVIIPFAQTGLAQQQVGYSWQTSRPPQGRGRTDTFNPTKITVFHMPDDHTIGTVDLPVIWNQRSREGLWLHWDGNNDLIKERNFAAAMAIGATPDSVIQSNFSRVTQFVRELAPPAYPGPIDSSRVPRGWVVFESQCAKCHDFGTQRVGEVTKVVDVGTDRHRLESFSAALVTTFHSIHEAPFLFDGYRKTEGYSNLPIDGTWARAPYLHNGSVPTLWDLLQPVEKRPKTFYKGYDVYDFDKLGFVSDGPQAQAAGFLLDTSVAGNSNQGHLYGTQLSDAQKRDLMEFLKTY
jgi:hypothetical protein